MFNDEWMRAKGFLEVSGMTARDLVALGVSGELFAVEAARPVGDAVRVMSDHDFSQISITQDGRVIGSLNETHLYEEFIGDPGRQVASRSRRSCSRRFPSSTSRRRWSCCRR